MSSRYHAHHSSSQGGKRSSLRRHLKIIARGERTLAIGLPPFIWQLTFFYFPLVFIILISVIKFSFSGNFIGWTTENFTSIFSYDYFRIIMRSLVLSGMTACFCWVIGYPLACFLSCYARRFKAFLLFLFVIPFWTNLLLHVYSWCFVLEKSGFVNQFLLMVGWIKWPIRFLNSSFAIILMMIYCYLPFMVLPIFSALERFNHHLLEASQDLGASWYQTWRNITLPLTFPAIRAGFFLVFISSFGEFIIPELIGGDKQYYVGNVISQYMLGETTRGVGSAFMILSCGCLAVTIFFVNLILKKIERSLGGII